MSGRRRTRNEVTRLIEQIRTLVAEQRQLGEDASGAAREVKRREIARLQGRLATAVKHELSH